MPFEKPTHNDLVNRYTYHPPKDGQADRYEMIRSACLGLAVMIVDMTPCSRDQALALNALDEVMFRANASIARNE